MLDRAGLRFLTALVGAAVALAPGTAGTQQAKPTYRIGVLTSAFAPNHPAVEGLKAGLKALGQEEGRDVVFDIRFSRGEPELMPAFAAELVKAGVDLLYTTNDVSAQVVKATGSRIPMVFVNVGDPVALGLVAAAAHPGGNVTGVSGLNIELGAKRLEILKAIAPSVRRVWAICGAGDRQSLAAARVARDAGPRLKLEVRVQAVNTAEDLARALKALRSGDGLLAPVTPLKDLPGRVLEASLASRLPAVFPAAFWIRYGALVSYGADYYAEGVQAARLVARILGGARPRDLPVEGANKIELGINLKTAKTFGLPVPQALLMRADQVVQ